MRTLGAIWLIFGTQLSTVLRSKRAFVCLVLALGPALVVMLPPLHVAASEVVWMVGMMLLLQLIAPLIGLLAGSAVLTEEIENRTITYAFTRPVPRVSLFLGRYLATLVLVGGLLALSAVAVVSIPALRGRENDLGPGVLWDLVTAAVLAGAIYSLITGALGVFVKRPMVVGLFYLIAMEGLLANLPGASQRVTLQYHLRGIFTRLGVQENDFLRRAPMIEDTMFLPPTESIVRLLIFMGLAVGAAAWGIRRRQYVLTS